MEVPELSVVTFRCTAYEECCRLMEESPEDSGRHMASRGWMDTLDVLYRGNNYTVPEKCLVVVREIK